MPQRDKTDWEIEARGNRKDRETLIALARLANSPRVHKNPWAPSYGDNWTTILAEEPVASAYVLALRPDVLLRVLDADKDRDGLIKRIWNRVRRPPKINVGVTLFIVAMGFSSLVIDFPGTYLCCALQALVLCAYYVKREIWDPRLLHLCFALTGAVILGGLASSLGIIMHTSDLCERAAQYQASKAPDD
jgi:hypothetical protein